MNKPSLVHPDLMDSLKENFLTKKIDIQEVTTTNEDVYNKIVETWSDKFTGIECAIGPDQEQEDRQGDKTVRRTVKRVILDGKYDIAENDRVVIDSVNYDILSVEFGMTETKTSLVIQKLKV